MIEATVWSRLSGAGLLARSVMISCQRSTAASLFLRPWTSFFSLPSILMYHHPSERRNQGCACRAMIEPPNPEFLNGNPEVDWKGPLQLLARLVPGREAILIQAILSRKVQRKVQNTISSSTFLQHLSPQVFDVLAVTVSGRQRTRTFDFHRVRMAL